MDRLAIFTNARTQVEALRIKFPGVQTLESIVRQIDYLIDLQSGRIEDRSRLKDIVLGVQAAREVEPLDSSVAEILYAVNEQAQKM